MKKSIYLITVLTLSLAVISCKKDSEGSGLKAVFSYVADGYKVNFTNFSTNAKEYSWDFGDGSGDSSKLKGPQHIFTSKGDYLVTLTAKNGTDVSTFTDTVTIIGPNIRIDGDFTDWTYVPFSFENPPGFSSTIKGIKTFASSDMINVYLEGDAGMNLDVIDMYIDADNNPASGYAAWMYPGGSGADFLCEGSPFGGWGDIYSHVGPGTGWGWNWVASFSDALNFSTLKTSSGKKMVEFSIKKSLLGSVSRFINIGFIENNASWVQVGIIPETSMPDSKFLAIPL